MEQFTMTRYTGIDSEMVAGSLISDLPEPWHSAISAFLQEATPARTV